MMHIHWHKKTQDHWLGHSYVRRWQCRCGSIITKIKGSI